MFGKFRRKGTAPSFENVRVDSGSYLDMDVSITGSLNINENNSQIQASYHRNREVSSPQSSFSSPYLETLWTTENIIQFILYLIFQTFMPFYWSISDQIWDYPLTASCIQFMICILLLFIYNIIRFHCCFDYHPMATSPTASINNINSSNKINSDLSSWANIFNSSKTKSKRQKNSKNISNSAGITTESEGGRSNNYFCHHLLSRFWPKFKLIILPSSFFIFNIVVTKVGVSQGSMDIHVLLKATEIIWFVILSPFLLTDYPSKSSVVCAIMITIGAVFFSWTNIKETDCTLVIIACNLLSAIFKPLHILFLRRATRILNVEESETRKIEQIDVMSKGEIALFYLFWGCLIMIPFQFIFEGIDGWKMINHQFGPTCNWIIIVIGAILVFLYQYIVVCLTSNVEPILIGIGQQSEHLWQLIVSLILGGITLQICGCLVDDASDGDECIADLNDDDINNRYPICPCWSKPENIFIGKSKNLVLHWFGVLMITLGFIFYCYLKAKNLHVTNINIFKCGNRYIHY